MSGEINHQSAFKITEAESVKSKTAGGSRIISSLVRKSLNGDQNEEIPPEIDPEKIELINQLYQAALEQAENEPITESSFRKSENFDFKSMKSQMDLFNAQFKPRSIHSGKPDSMLNSARSQQMLLNARALSANSRRSHDAR